MDGYIEPTVLNDLPVWSTMIFSQIHAQEFKQPNKPSSAEKVCERGPTGPDWPQLSHGVYDSRYWNSFSKPQGFQKHYPKPDTFRPEWDEIIPAMATTTKPKWKSERPTIVTVPWATAGSVVSVFPWAGCCRCKPYSFSNSYTSQTFKTKSRHNSSVQTFVCLHVFCYLFDLETTFRSYHPPNYFNLN